MKISGIYKIECLSNGGKTYIGSSKSIAKRFSYHRGLLRHSKHSNRELQHDWDKYGEDSFNFEIIMEYTEKDDLIAWEQFYLDKLEPFENGYNKNRKAGSPQFDDNGLNSLKNKLSDFSSAN